MVKLIDSLQTKTAFTDNWAVTNVSSLDSHLDMFFLAGASRNMTDSDIVALFSKAFAEDKNLALKILFWARDVRGWAGERRFFRVILKYLAEKDNINFNKLLSYVVEYWRWDDLFFDDNILDYTIDFIVNYIKSIDLDDKSNGLLFKWMPREKSKRKKVAVRLRKALGLGLKEYRKLLSENSSTVEQLISENKWSDVQYSGVPSKAFNLYRDAFKRHDESRFSQFIEKVSTWEETIKAGAIFPVDIYRSWVRGSDVKSIDAQWSQLPDYMNDENIMPVCDTSGSMTGWWNEMAPIDVSVSLWVYLSERTKGKFKDHFITFEWKPKLQSLKGSVTDRFRQLKTCYSDMSTNIQWVFDLLLSVAKRDWLTDDDMPSKLLIISDMEFNYVDEGLFGVSSKTNFDVIREKYEASGYKMPWLIFWNVNGRPENVPVQKTDKNVALVSGYSPSIVKSVLGWEDLTPIGVMMKTVENYKFIDEVVE